MVDNNTKNPGISSGFTNVVMVPNSSNLADGIITSNSTTIAIHKLSDSRTGGSGSIIPRPPSSPRTLTTPSSNNSALTTVGPIQQQSMLTVQTLPRKLGHHTPQTESVAGASSGSVTLEALGDSIQTLGRGRPHLPLPSILVSSTSASTSGNSGRSSVEPNHASSVTSSSSRRSSNISEFRLSSALNALDLDNLDLRNIDPTLASKLLSEIRNGADIGPLLEKLKSDQLQSNPSSASSKSEMKKVVTFEDDITKPPPGMPKPSTSEDEILKADDVFM